MFFLIESVIESLRTSTLIKLKLTLIYFIIFKKTKKINYIIIIILSVYQ